MAALCKFRPGPRMHGGEGCWLWGFRCCCSQPACHHALCSSWGSVSVQVSWLHRGGTGSPLAPAPPLPDPAPPLLGTLAGPLSAGPCGVTTHQHVRVSASHTRAGFSKPFSTCALAGALEGHCDGACVLHVGASLWVLLSFPLHSACFPALAPHESGPTFCPRWALISNVLPVIFHWSS